MDTRWNSSHSWTNHPSCSLSARSHNGKSVATQRDRTHPGRIFCINLLVAIPHRSAPLVIALGHGTETNTRNACFSSEFAADTRLRKKLWRGKQPPLQF
jgi:hypothetical protein